MCENEQKPKLESEPYHEKREIRSRSHNHENEMLRSRNHVRKKKSSGARAVSFLRRLRNPFVGAGQQHVRLDINTINERYVCTD